MIGSGISIFIRCIAVAVSCKPSGWSTRPRCRVPRDASKDMTQPWWEIQSDINTPYLLTAVSEPTEHYTKLCRMLGNKSRSINCFMAINMRWLRGNGPQARRCWGSPDIEVVTRRSRQELWCCERIMSWRAGKSEGGKTPRREWRGGLGGVARSPVNGVGQGSRKVVASLPCLLHHGNLLTGLVGQDLVFDAFETDPIQTTSRQWMEVFGSWLRQAPRDANGRLDMAKNPKERISCPINAGGCDKETPPLPSPTHSFSVAWSIPVQVPAFPS